MKIKSLSQKLKIIWIGPFIPGKETINWPASSPAASKWQKNLIESLTSSGFDIKWLYYRPDSYWPKGRLIPSKKKISSDIIFKCKQIDYLNFFGFRNFTKKFYLNRILKNINQNSNKKYSTVLITYNAPKWINEIFLNKEISKDFIQIYLLADDQKPNIGDGYIFLSYHSFKKYRFSNKLYLDGAIYTNSKKLSSQKFIKKNKKIIFFYSGSMHKWGGIKLLLESIKLIKSNDFELWISGPGDPKLIKLKSNKDKRIKFLGLLTDNQLKLSYQKASVFLNPRPINMPGNELNFPSKLFDYLAWKKPIISTWTKSLSPEYKNILHISKDNPKAFSEAMISYINKKQMRFKIDENFIKKKNWKNQAERLIFFLNKIVKNNNKDKFIINARKKN